MHLIGQCDSVFELNWGTLCTVPKKFYPKIEYQGEKPSMDLKLLKF